MNRRKFVSTTMGAGMAMVARCAGVPFPIFDEEPEGRLALRNHEEGSVSVTVAITSQYDDSFERVDEYDLEPDLRRVINEWLMKDGMFVVEAKRENGRRNETDGWKEDAEPVQYGQWKGP